MCGMCDVTRYQGDTKGLLFPSIYVNIVLSLTHKGSFVFKYLCKYCIVLNTHKGVMTCNDVREECLECHMTPNDVREECYITMITGRCVNKPDQTEPVGCYENTFISKFAKCV